MVKQTLPKSAARVKRAIPNNVKISMAAAYGKIRSARSVAAEFGVSNFSVLSAARKYGIPRRGVWDTRGRLTINHFAFSAITTETAYWVGFLMADGWISQDMVNLTLAACDIGHIEKFKSFLCSGHKITNVRNGIAFMLCVRSQKMVSDLSKYGVVPRKSMTAKVSGLESDLDFWRGVIDGDGTLYAYRTPQGIYPSISLCGSFNLLSQFRDFVIKISPECVSSVRPMASIFQFKTVGRHASAVIKVLYGNPGVSLDRKQEKANYFLRGDHLIPSPS